MEPLEVGVERRSQTKMEKVQPRSFSMRKTCVVWVPSWLT